MAKHVSCMICHGQLITEDKTVPDSEVSVAFLNHVSEPTPLAIIQNELTPLINNFKKKYINAKIVVILNDWQQKCQDQITIPGADQIVIINYQSMRVYHRIFNISQGKYANKWSPDPDKFLCLTGKPDRNNRIRLLYKLKQAKLLDHAVWSFFMPKEAYNDARQLIPELSDCEFSSFVEETLSNPDKIWLHDTTNSLHYSGIPFDHNMYLNSKFQVVSETLFDTIRFESPCISEKTWLPILNHRPFIMVAEPGHLTELKRMGFRTFDQYLPISNYDEIEDSEQRLDAVVINIKFWLKNIDQYADEILNDVNLNFQKFKELAQQTQDIIQGLINNYSLDCDIDDVVVFHDPYTTIRWQTFYNNIRDSSWPDCKYEENFHLLPTHVQQECIEIYGYLIEKKL